MSSAAHARVAQLGTQGAAAVMAGGQLGALPVAVWGSRGLRWQAGAHDSYDVGCTTGCCACVLQACCCCCCWHRWYCCVCLHCHMLLPTCCYSRNVYNTPAIENLSRAFCVCVGMPVCLCVVASSRGCLFRIGVRCVSFRLRQCVLLQRSRPLVFGAVAPWLQSRDGAVSLSAALGMKRCRGCAGAWFACQQVMQQPSTNNPCSMITSC